jgi:signal transduction histidine kinase
MASQPPRGAPREGRFSSEDPPERLTQRYDTLLGTYDPVRPPREPRRVQRARVGLAAILIVTFAVLSWLTYEAVDRRLRLNMQQQLDAILHANERAARAWLEGREQITRQVASSGPVREASRRLADPGSVTAAEHLLAEALNPLRMAGLVENYYLLDGASRVRATSDPSARGLLLEEHAAVTRLRGAASTTAGPLPPITPPSEEAPLALYVVSAARVSGGSDAALLLSFDPKRLAQLFADGRWGETGEVYAFNRDGMLLTESRFAAEAAQAGLLPPGEERTSLNLRLEDRGRRPTPDGSGKPSGAPLTAMAERATRGESGIDVEGYRNYLGHQVIGAWTWLDQYGVGLATEVGVSDAFASTLVVRRAALLMVALMLTAAVGFTLLGQWALRLRRQSVAVTRRLDRLARAIQPLSAALETDPTAVLLVDERLQVVYANPAAAGLLPSPLDGSHVSEVLSSLPPTLRDALIDGQDTVVALGDDASGDTLLVSSRELAIDGRLHALYMLRPVTQELRRQEVEHWKKLIRVLSHELNNSLAPITSLVSSARKLAQGTEQEAQLDKVFGIITERTQHLLAFLESYRSIARLPRPTRADVGWEEFLDGLRAQMRFELVGDLPHRRGYFDATQMERVLLNLLKNAHEAGGPPEEVRLRIVEEGEGTRIDVLDRGTGMSRAVLEQATLPFYSTKRTGTGVGLALSREIVEAHRGRLTLANREGGGLCASVWLPPRTEHRLSTTM